MYIYVGGARGVDGQAECLQDQILPDVFGLESGVTTEGWSPLVLYYDHVNSITRNMQLLYMLLCSCWLSNSGIPDAFLPFRRSRFTGAGRRKLTINHAASFLEAAEYGLEIYAPHAGCRARNKCSFHGQRRFGRRVPPDELVPP